MKKALTILVIFAIVLSLSASAFADNGGIKITKNPSGTALALSRRTARIST